MLPEIKSLLVIQDRDHHIQALQSEIQNIPQQAANIKRKFEDATATLNAAKEAVLQNELAVKKINLDRKTRQDTIGKLEKQRFETKKNDEYDALGAEVDRYQAMVDALETEELECMEKTDALKATLAQAKEALTDTKASLTTEVKNLSEKKVQNSARIEELLNERASLAQKIDPPLLASYERVFSKKGDTSVVPLHENQCGSCHMKVTSEVINKTIEEKEISHCNLCGCFLYSV